MKSCPACGARYTDDLSFCLQDGTRLAGGPTDDLSGQPTEVFRQDTAIRRDSSTFETLPSEPVQAAAPTKRYQFSAVDPSSKMGCIVTFGTLGLLLVSGFALIASYYNFSGKNVDVASSSPKAANISERPSLDTASNTSSANAFSNSNANPNSAVPTHTETANVAPTVPPPAATKKPTASPTPEPTQTAKTVTANPTPVPEDSPVFVFRQNNRVVAGGNLNGRATSLPQPPYPPIARSAGVGGMVAVRVLVDERGSVVAAEAIRGHPLLRPAAVSAARAARFNPTMMGGEPVRVRGVLTYNFIP